MNDAALRTVLGLLLFASCAPGAVAQFREEMSLSEVVLSGKTPESIILLWPTFSYRLARMMIARYGQPDDANDHSLTWVDNAPWKKTVVYRIPPGTRPIIGDGGRLEQSVAYQVPEDRVADLGRFDKGIEVDREAGLLTVTSDAESENFLALNLADEVIQRKRTPKEAVEQRRVLMRLRDAGKASPYYEGLLFAAPPAAP